ncbi:neuromedin-K receptor-like [Gigantopelta aegis]|uniref:neuromedin-K receptor-like n=1 Tax=Gigantopelta aegis TaxID=1735272 RepID=UPI001B88B691|nr:neuromedin-K receptor-like [Gigantopelta aegis]
MYIFPSTGDLLCRVVNFFPLFCIMVSIYSMVTISFERRRAIVLSMDQNPMKIIKMVLPALWIGSFVVCIPTIIEYNEFLTINPLTNETDWRCGSIQSNVYSQTNAFMLIFVAYIIPLFMVVINYIVIIKFIWKKCKLDGATNQRCLMVKKKLQIIKMMVLAAVFFAAAWAPYFTSLAIGKITGLDGTEESGGTLNLIRLTLSAFSTAYNVFLYVIYNQNFRDGFKAMCPICFSNPRNSVVPAHIRAFEMPVVVCNKQYSEV